MQNRLEEVELSSPTGPGMTVFGSEHSRALDDLRRAQIELAKAWARSEAEESGQVQEERQSAKGTDAADMLASEHVEKMRTGSVGAGSGVGSTFERSRLEEETERDIELSRKRREANDQYFEKVNKGVLEVVTKLEEVARAMKGVELESKEMFHSGESADDTGSHTTRSSMA
jgi:septum formation topological specificity factor MinE